MRATSRHLFPTRLMEYRDKCVSEDVDIDKSPPPKGKNKAATAGAAAAAGPAQSRKRAAAGKQALAAHPVSKKVTRRSGRRRR